MPKVRLDHHLGECTRNYFVPALLARNARGHKKTPQPKSNQTKIKKKHLTNVLKSLTCCKNKSTELNFSNSSNVTQKQRINL